MSRCSEGQMPGSGETRPNPVFCAMPTHPDHTPPRPGRPGPAAAKTRWSGRDGPSPGTGPRWLVWWSWPARITQPLVHDGGGVDADCSHAGHHPSVVASGWGSPVSAASAAATSDRLART